MADTTQVAAGGTPAAAPPAVAAATPPAASAAPVATPPSETPAATVATPAAEEFKLSFPEGFTSDETTEKFTGLAKQLGLKSGDAQKVFDLYVGAEKARSERALAERETTLKKWDGELRADKDFGGDKYDASMKAATDAMKKFGSPKLAEAMEQTGFGGHPEMLRYFARVGALLREDSLGGVGDAPASKPSEAEQLAALLPKTAAALKGK